ncbi:hypothetical protein Pla110_29180 [Polystyrenella longa]|uniref:Uncharacterized protein n=1 Tax=Polystyrenella longa TaxID=2528007 RepID=A0A518CPN6_9PLAN|nr:hypothetical protein Pla110_29180 [Polystyrenella longa]
MSEQQAASEATETLENKGPTCPVCGLGVSGITRTKSKPGITERERTCRNCGNKYLTKEILVGGGYPSIGAAFLNGHKESARYSSNFNKAVEGDNQPA